MSRMRKMYLACLCIFVLGTLSHIALDAYWHAVSPHVIDVATGHTYALSGRGGTVFVTPIAGRLLEWLQFFPLSFLVLGMLAWARTWREWS